MTDPAAGNPAPLPDDPMVRLLNFDQLAQLVNEVSPDVFHQRADAFERAAARLRDAVGQLRRQLNIVRDAWTGDGADDFDALAREVTGRVTGTVQTMSIPGYGAVLRAAGDALAAHQRRMRDLQGRKTEDEGKPSAPGAPAPEQTAVVHHDSAQQILLDLRTAYWDIGNQLPVLSEQDTRIDGTGSGQGAGTSDGSAYYDRPLITNASLLAAGGDLSDRGYGDGGYQAHRNSPGPKQYESAAPSSARPWRAGDPAQEPGQPLYPLVSQAEQPGHIAFGSSPASARSGAPLDEGEYGFAPSVLGRPSREEHFLSEADHRPGEKRRKREEKTETVRGGPIGASPAEETTANGAESPEGKTPAVVRTAIDSPAAPAGAVPGAEHKFATSAGEPVPTAATSSRSLAQTTGQTPLPDNAVQFSDAGGEQPPSGTHAASFGAGGGGAASGAFKPEDRGMFTPGSGGTGAFQGLDPSGAAAAHVPKPGPSPADPVNGQSGGMPMPMMGGMGMGMAGAGGHGGQQNSRMAAMPVESRPDAWPLGSGSPGTLGRREQEHRETAEPIVPELPAAHADKLAELDRLLGRGN
ncbi:WXG100 family type VII secretion target [Amycolatopsis sp. PS_44_ISF1]|uniref:WXG100 family type VII secretion target n=1 Tax=Amycolatopsis sp. PS_44_ISF1 TaxID=2974917 RepID=UPI0028DE00AB|nr:WXG100 family type VII secretion target [Amycolatopsis sp. PS_44_ISF1]MDT8912075.1 WXG100 family type VII secretion target [Amycolatopsis sp. PS_44_ISF1]